MFNILGIDHIVLRTKDVNGMLAFYTEVLGCPLERQLTEFGLFQLRAGKSLIDLVDVDGPIGKSAGEAPGNEARNVDHFCLRIDPFEPTAIFRHLDQQERYGAEGNGLSIYISDPEGNTVELKGPASN